MIVLELASDIDLGSDRLELKGLRKACQKSLSFFVNRRIKSGLQSEPGDHGRSASAAAPGFVAVVR